MGRLIERKTERPEDIQRKRQKDCKTYRKKYRKGITLKDRKTERQNIDGQKEGKTEIKKDLKIERIESFKDS